MTAQEFGSRLDQEWLDKLYGYAYRRCSSSHEAEDLCADIVLALLKSFSGGCEIRSFASFVWGVAHKVYADHCSRRKRDSICTSVTLWGENTHGLLESAWEDPVEERMLREEEQQLYRDILKRMAFLSKIYRDVMVMYYLDGRKISDIAQALSLSETGVKQRLFTARNTIRKEVDRMNMNTAVTLKPIHLEFIGTGNPVGNDPWEKAERTLSQNLVYLCKNKALSAKELSEALGVPMPYIEEEIDIQCRGQNGSYGLLRRLGNGKVIANIVIFDRTEYKAASAVYQKHAAELCRLVARNIEAHREDLLSFPFLRPQQDVRFILWSVISGVDWALAHAVGTRLEQHFADTPPARRPFSTVAFAASQGEEIDYGFYGCDGITALNICGYRQVFVRNIYGRHIQFHFHCGHDIANDPLLMMTIQSIDGLPVASLSPEEQETASKAIACGYLERDGDTLYPKILVLDQKDEAAFGRLSELLAEGMEPLADTIAEELAALIGKTLPPHLHCEYQLFNMGATVGLVDMLAEACIDRGLLVKPENPLCAEGTLLVVSK